MEEEFKKRKEGDGGEDEIARESEVKGLEVVGEVLDVILDDGVGVMKAGAVDDVLLEEVCEEDLMEGNLSWGAAIGESEEGLKRFLGEGCLEEAARAEKGVLDGGRILDRVKEVALGRSGGSGNAAAGLNWKQAVVGGGDKVHEGCSGASIGSKGYRDGGAARGAVKNRSGVDGGGGVKVKGNGGGPGKVCREIKFDEKGGGFLDAYGETMHMDRREVLECEKY